MNGATKGFDSCSRRMSQASVSGGTVVVVDVVVEVVDDVVGGVGPHVASDWSN